MLGKLIVIEGTDSSGKKTQAKKLYKRLVKEGYNAIKIEYPNYSSDSSALIKMYLNGNFGKDPEDVNAYVASTFYAVDRFASFKTEWSKFYEDGGIIIADRYTTSNMVHQASKIENLEERDKYLKWLWELEFVKFELPIPNQVFFLNMPPSASSKLMENRKNKFTGKDKKDIHENNQDHLQKSYDNACRIAHQYKWHEIDCTNNNSLKSINEIHNDIYMKVKESL